MTTNSLRNEFHTDVAQTIASEIQYKRSNYYYFLGKIESWDTIDQSPNSVQLDSQYENSMIRTNSVFMRKISPNDVSLVTTRYDWITGTIFSIFDHTKNLKTSNFYCVTDDNNVYKCLDNKANSPSTVKPTGKSFYVFRTADGYLWKYMYTVPTFKRSRFQTLNHLPVQRSLTDSFYNKGSVDSVYVTSGGSGYADVLLTTIGVNGTTTGSGATGTVICGPTGNITGVTVTNGGTGYTKGVSIEIISTNGTGAKLTGVMTAGVITSLDIINSGIGYQTGDVMSFTVGGAILIPSVSRITGSITSVTIKNPGAGYVSAPTLIVSGISGIGKYDNPTALLSAIVYNGSIVQVNTIDPGVNYPTDNNTSIVVQGDGTGAIFSPVIDTGEVVDVVIENPGTGYTSINLTVVGTGTGAVVTPIISASDFSSEQSIVEQTTISGAIYSVVITIPGNNYSSLTTVSIVGDGFGCVVVPVITSGAITRIDVLEYGTGYTYANIIITDPLRSVFADFENTVAYAVMSPLNGHGYDAVSELFGDTLCVNSSLRQDANLNKLLQDYRQFGLIKNPKNILTGKLSTEDSTLLLFESLFDNVTGLVIDEILIQDLVKFRVVHVDGLKVYLQQLGSVYKNIVGTIIAETNTSRVYTINTVTQYPVVNKYSGNLLYVSNENPFTFSQEQGIIIKTFLKF